MITPEIIGMPGSMVALDQSGDPYYPKNMYDQIIKTMPIAYFTPCVPNYQSGLELYTLDIAMVKYKEYLTAAGISIGTQGSQLKVMYNNISSLGESYGSNFSQSSLSAGMESIASEGLQDIMFMTGKNIPQNVDALAKQEGPLGDLGKMLQKAGNKADEKIEGMESGKMKHIAKQAMSILKNPNNKIDFPQMWRSSSFSASYQLSIRLYNPIPASNTHYENLIVASLGALLGLSLPTSEEDNLYKWPFLLRFEVPGLVKLDAAYISNLVVAKGGDQNDLSWNQKWIRPNMVDINMTITPLYNVMLMAMQEGTSDRPTLKKEIDNMLTLNNQDVIMPYSTTYPPQLPDYTINRSGSTPASDAINGTA